MTKWKLQTPVVLMIFKRPETTQKVFEKIRQAKPPLLLVIADGPRSDQLGEDQKCTATRAIIERVDWNCQVLKNYSDVNLGCGLRSATGLEWVFNTVEEAIILEDDCVPHPTFFRFCEELLEQYRHDQRIMSISGQNVQFGTKRTAHSYYFSRYNHCWGWATWRRAWQYYDFEMKLWLEIRDNNILKNILVDPDATRTWTKTFQSTYEHPYSTWDYQFTFACWVQNSLNIIANANLVSNIGHGSEATHTNDESSPFSNMLAEAMDFPLKHPDFVIRHQQADDFTEKHLFNYHPRLFKRVHRKLRNIIKPYKKSVDNFYQNLVTTRS